MNTKSIKPFQIHHSLAAGAILAALLALCAAPSARAATYYWDNNSTTAGFGTAGGTWGTDSLWSTNAAGGASTIFTNTTVSGDVVNFGTASVALGAGTVNVSGSVTNTTLNISTISPNLVLSGGTIVLAGTTPVINASASNSVINSAILLLANATINAPNVAGNGAVAVPMTLGGAISGGFNVTLYSPNTVNAYDTINLNGQSTYTGTTTINTAGGGGSGSELFVNLGIDNALPTTTTLTLNGGAGAGSGRYVQLDLKGHNQTLAGLASTSGLGSRNEIVTSSSGTPTLTVSNNASYQFGYGGTNGTLTGSLALNVVATNNSPATLTLGGNNTYNGATTISGGRVTISVSGALSSSTSVTQTNGGQLFVSAAGTYANSLSLSGQGFNDTSYGNYDGAVRLANSANLSGLITLGTAATPTYIGFLTSSAGIYSETISGQITGSGGLNFYSLYGGTTSGSGVIASNTVILANTGTANNYSGNTYIDNNYTAKAGSGGPDNTILKLGASEQIPNGPGMGILVLEAWNTANANRACTFELNGFNETVNGINNSTVGGLGNTIQNTTLGASTLTIGDADTNSTYGGTIKDGGTGKTLAITKIGAGTLTLSGANTYIGNTTVSAGTLSLSGTGSLTGSSVTTSGTGVVTEGATSLIAGSGVTFTQGSTGTSTLYGTNTYTGLTTISAGELKFSTIGTVAATTIRVAGGATNGVLVASTGGQWASTGDLTNQASSFIDINYGGTTPSTTTAPLSVVNFVTNANLTVLISGGALAAGQGYPLVTWSGSGPGDASAFAPPVLPNHTFGSLAVLGNTLYLTNVTSTEPLTWNTGSGNWDTTTSNWVDQVAAVSAYVDGADAVMFDDAAGATGNPVVSLNSVFSPLGVTMKSTINNYTIIGTGGIAGGTSLTLDPANTMTLTLTTTNTYTGGTTIGGGTLTIGGAGRLGNGTYAGAIAISNSATLEYSGIPAQTLSGNITGAGALTADSTNNNSLTLSGTANTYSGLTTISNAIRIAAGPANLSPNTTFNIVGNSTNGGQLYLNANGTVGNNLTLSGVGYADTTPFGAIRMANGNTLTGTITLAGDARVGIFLAGRGSNFLNGQFTGNHGLELYRGASTSKITNFFVLGNTGTANNYTGNTTISCQDYTGTPNSSYTNGQATLELGANEQIPNGVGDGMVVFNGANANHLTVLDLNGFNETVNGVTNVSAAGAIIQNTAASSASTLTIGDADTSSLFTGNILDGGGSASLALTKIGAGTVTLSGANTYTGLTTVNAGELKFSTVGTVAATTVTVAGGATNGVLVASSGGQWATTGDLTNQAGSVIDINYGGTAPSTTTAPLSVANFWTNSSLTMTVSGVPGLFVAGQSYPLITWSGSGPGDASAFAPPVLPNHTSGSLAVLGSTLYLTNVTSSEPLTWNTGSGNWDTATSNWVDQAAALSAYVDGADAVMFDDATGATGNPTVTLNSTFSPAGVTMKSTSHNYTITGTGGIAGGTALVLDPANTRTLILATSNSYTGGTFVNAGTLEADTNSALGTGLVTMSGGTLTNNISATLANPVNLSAVNSIVGVGGSTLTLSGNLTNTGALTVAGPGTLLLSGTNSYRGNTTINAGTLQVNNVVSGIGTGQATINANGTLKLMYPNSSSPTFTNALTGAGTVAITATGAAASTITPGFNPASLAGFMGTITVDTSLTNIYPKLTASGIIDGSAARWVVTGNRLTNSFLFAPSASVLRLGELSGNGTVAGSNTTTNNVEVGALNTSTNFSGLIENNIFGGALGLTKVGSGTWTLTGTNTYTGNTTLGAGTLALSGGGTITGSTVITVAGGATFDVSAKSPTFALGGRTLGNSSDGGVISGTSDCTAGTLALVFDGVSPCLIQTNGVMTLSVSTVVNVNNTGVTIGTGTNVLIAAAAGATPGSFTGTLPAVTVTGNGAAGLASLFIDGAGNLDLVIADSPQAWTGASTTSWLDAGSWLVGVPGAGSNAVFNSYSTAHLATVLNANFNLGTLYLTTPSGPVSIDGSGGVNSLTLTNGINMSAASRPLTITAPVVLGASQSWTVTNAQTLTVNGAVSGSSVLTVAGGGTVVLGSANGYTGGTIINAGTLQLSGAGTPGPAGASVAVSSGALLDLNGTSQSIKFTAGTGTGTVANNSGSGISTLTIAGTATIFTATNVIIQDSTNNSGGKVAVVIQANTQPLNNLNTYSGGTTVNAGAFLYLSSANPNGAGTGAITLTALGANGATSSGLVVDGVTYSNDITGAGYVHNNTSSGASTTTLTGNINTSGPFIFRGGTGIIYNFAGNGTTSVLSGVIGSTTSMVNGAVATGSLIKSGSGLLTLSGLNNYTGSTTINGGTLAISSTGQLYKNATGGTITVNSGGTLQVYAWQYALNGSIGNPYFTTPNGLVVNGGTITYTGIGEYNAANSGRWLTIGTGGATLNADGTGTWFISADTSQNFQNAGITNGLTLTGSSNGEIDKNLTGTTSDTLIKSGAGTWILTGTNIYSGGTVINGGTLLVNNAGGSGTGTGAVNVNSGGTLSGSGSIAGPVTNNAGGTLFAGTNGVGALTLTGNLTLNAGSTNTFVVNGDTSTASNSVALGGAVTYGGVLNLVTNGTFTIGQSFTLFSGAGATQPSNFDSIAGSPGAGLAFSFTNGVLSVVSAAPPLSSTAFLSALVVSNNLNAAVVLTPGFYTNLPSGPYAATNTLPANQVNVTVTDADPTATNTLFLGGVSQGLLASGSTSSLLGLNPGSNNVTVQVVSQDLTVTNSYTVNVFDQPSQTRPVLTNSVSGGTNLMLSWAGDHLGYRLLMQTNNLAKGVSSVASDWGTVPGSQSITATNILINKAGGTNEFYRLVYP